MAEIEDIKSIIMGGVDQPILNPHNLIGSVDRAPTQEGLGRRIERLEHRNTYLKKRNEQLQELTAEFERACISVVKQKVSVRDGHCFYCGEIDHSSVCIYSAVKRVLKLKAKFDTASKRLGGE